MCNLYSLTKGQAAIIALIRAMVDKSGVLPSLPGIFTDYFAPTARNSPDGRELVMARWGMPFPSGRSSMPPRNALKSSRRKASRSTSLPHQPR
jgi:hypothetical protein